MIPSTLVCYNITSHSSNVCNEFFSWYPIKILARTGPNGDPIARPSIWSKKSYLQTRNKSSKLEELFRSAFDILKPGSFSKSKSTATSIVSVHGMLVNKLQTS